MENTEGTMNPRINYEMTEADLVKILDACKPTPAMWGSGGAKLFDSPQENANRAWKELGDRMGFNSMTVQPQGGLGPRFFTAVPTETPEQRKEREARLAEEQKQQKITQLRAEIFERETELLALTGKAEA